MMATRNIPHFPQLTNTCGLSSLLMIAMPKGTSLEPLLTTIAKRMGDLAYWNSLGLGDLRAWIRQDMKGEQLSLFWQVASAYLLMKTCFNPILSSQLQQQFPDEYDYFKMILMQQLEDRRSSYIKMNNRQAAMNINYFLKTGIVRKIPLQEYLFEMKTNLELKMLAHLFGGEQKLFPSPDGTGCIFLDGKDDKKKLETLYQHVSDGIIIGLGYHWLAVQGMEQEKKNQYNFIIHDPMGQRKIVPIDKIESNYRFYVFHFEDSNRLKLDTLIRQALHLPSKK